MSNTLDADFCVDALEEALSKGKPEVFNTDQGSQFTSEAFTGLLEQHGVRVSMDGKGRYTDNLFIERLWRSLKYEEVYLKAYTGGRDARIGIGEYFRFYNTERPHQALEYQTPAEVFISNNHVVTQGNDVQSGNPLTSLEALEAAGPALNMAPILSEILGPPQFNPSTREGKIIDSPEGPSKNSRLRVSCSALFPPVA